MAAATADPVTESPRPSTLRTTAEVAARLGVSAKTVERWIKSKKLAAIRLPGGGVRVTEAELQKLESGGQE